MLLSPAHGKRLNRAGKPKTASWKQGGAGERANRVLPSLNAHKAQGHKWRLLIQIIR